jgi:lipopolysaccharide transport system ATP-binding protein
MNEPVIIAEHLSKTYSLGGFRANTLKEAVERFLFRKRTGKQLKREALKEIVALNDISFEVQQGEVLGIIGQNGAGKSTLLKILGEITKPTSGQVKIRGNVASVLDFGMGFQPELSGRDNIFLRGELLGMQRKEIREKLDQIIRFSEIEEFIDIPVKNYSDGMFLRLAFAIVAHLNADILVFDDVLSVGDASFQMKSSKKIESMIREGKTIIYVTHDLGELMKICSRVMFLEKGRLVESGPAQKIVRDYVEKVITGGKDQHVQPVMSGEGTSGPGQPRLRYSQVWDNPAGAPGNESVRIVKLEVRAPAKDPAQPICSSDPVEIVIEYEKLTGQDVIDVGFVLSHFRSVVFVANPLFDSSEDFSAVAAGNYRCIATVPGNFLNNSIYSIDINVLKNRKEILLHLSDLIFFRIYEDKSEFISLVQNFTKDLPGCIRPKLDWKTEIL